MYRDDRDALHEKLESLDKESEELRRQNELMRREILAMRQGQAYAPDVYRTDPRYLSPAQRAALSYHELEPFPIWATGLLNVLTLGLFPLIHFGLMHDKLPKASDSDPSAGTSIGFTFVPFYNLYWIFFNSLRFADRLNLQFRLRGMKEDAPRGLMIAASVLMLFPYLNVFIGLPILWTIASCLLQSSVNRLAALDRYEPWRTHRKLPQGQPQPHGPPPALPPGPPRPPGR